MTAIRTDVPDAAGGRSSNRGGLATDEVTMQVRGVQRGLQRVLGLRVVLQAVGAGLSAWLMLSLAGRVLPFAAGVWWAIALAAIVTVSGAAILWRSLGAITPLRAALWIEEHGGTGYALVDRKSVV